MPVLQALAGWSCSSSSLCSCQGKLVVDGGRRVSPAELPGLQEFCTHGVLHLGVLLLGFAPGWVPLAVPASCLVAHDCQPIPGSASPPAPWVDSNLPGKYSL